MVLVNSNNKSDPLKVQYGVPQGSILGPFLFIVYVNDLPNLLPFKFVMYADDTTFITSHNDVNAVKQMNNSMMGKATQWFQENRLSLNNKKTEHILFSLGNINNEQSHPVKLLGIYLDSKLCWNTHTEKLCSKLARVLYLLRKLKVCVSKELMLMAYYAFFHTHLHYGILLWGNSAGAKEVFLWHKKAIRCIFGLSKLTSCKQYFVQHKILTVPSLYVLKALMHARQNVDEYESRSDMHLYGTRNRNLLTFLGQD